MKSATSHPAKIDYRKELKELYGPPRQPVIVQVPPLNYLMIDGRGDPNTAVAYTAAIQALYSVSYAAKFAVRASGGGDFAVMPLEGLWWTPNMADFSAANKDAWHWTMMIMQPAMVSPAVFETARAAAAAAGKAPIESLDRLRLEPLEEGHAVQVLHLGPYAEEGPTIESLHTFIDQHGLVRSGRHHEIYLNDPRRTGPERLRTALRQPVAEPIDEIDRT